MERKYRFNYRIQIAHRTGASPKHRHTLEISFCILSTMEDEQPFNAIVQSFDSFMNRYQNRYLNEMEEFHGDTTIENIGEVICGQMDKAAITAGYKLYHFEIGETPLRMYIITDEP